MFTYLALAVILTANVYTDGAPYTAESVDPSKLDLRHESIINLKNVTIRELPRNYFRDLNMDVSLLRISNSRLSRIHREAFDGLDHLNMLELSDDGIAELHPETFTRLKGLEILHLRSNNLRSASLVLTNVQQLVLAQNEIEHFGSDSLQGPNLMLIDLSRNRLKQMAGSAKSFAKLATIQISNNHITHISPDVFVDNHQLTSLYASGNLLTSTNGLRLKHLKTLDLSSNRFTRLDNDSFAGMDTLDELRLQGNHISELDDPFAPMKNLHFLDLSNNAITEIDPGWFRHSPYLSKLILARNRISRVEPFKTKLVHLTILDLSHNNIEFINSDFFKTVDKLEILNLSFNRLTLIGDALTPLTSLVSLDLSSNRLVLDRNSTRSNVKLHNLGLSSNGLDLGLSYFEHNTLLGNLDLSRNNITNFCDATPSMESLTSIDLSYNQIKDLSCLKQKNMLLFPVVDIRNNPITCDSSFDDVVAYLISHQASPSLTLERQILGSDSSSFSPERSLKLWNSIKRDLCPNGSDIVPKEDHQSHEFDYENQGYYYDNYELYPDYTHSPEAEAEQYIFDTRVEVDAKNGGKEEKITEQSERESWESISKTENMEKNDDDDDSFHFVTSQLSLFKISLIFIGVSVILVVTNMVIFLFIRMRGWKKDFRGVQKYTHLENKVYKDTTVPNDYSTYGGGRLGIGDGSSSNNYRINCARMFVNFGFKSAEDDAESVKKMIVDNGAKIDV